MSIDDVIGHERAIGLIKKAISSGRVASAYLFAGEQGIGKKHTALNLASALNCKKSTDGCAASSRLEPTWAILPSQTGEQLPADDFLAAMKAHALGQRAKWKDYVDLFFAFKKHTINEVINKAREIFKKEFNEKLFREQLSYFDDLDYSERIDYLSGHKKDDSEIKEFLAEISLQK